VNRARRFAVEALEDRELLTTLYLPVKPEATNNGDPARLGTVSPGMPLYTIFWGSWWSTPFGQVLQTQIEDSLMPIFYNSAFLDDLHQYGVPNRAFIPNSPVHEVNNDSDPANGFSEASLESVIDYAVHYQGLPDSESLFGGGLYLVYTPPGINSDHLGAAGYHDVYLSRDYSQYDYTSNGVGGPYFRHIDTDFRHFAWLGLGDFGGLDEEPYKDEETYNTSHELTEAMTDPNPYVDNSGLSYFGLTASNSDGGEICDGEAKYYTELLDGYVVQSHWSAAANEFVISDGNSQKMHLDNHNLKVYGDQFGSSYNDSISLGLNDRGGVQVTLNGETFSYPYGQVSHVYVYTGAGSNSAYVHDTSSASPVTIYSGGTDMVYIGGTDGVQGINGSVDVENPNGHTDLIIDDSGNSYSSRTVNMDATGVYGLAPAPISYDQNGLSHLTIDTGSAGNTFYVANTPSSMWGMGTYIINHSGAGSNTIDIHATSEPLLLDGGAGSQYVNVGEGWTGYINGYVDVYNSSSRGSSYLYVDDHYDTVGRTADLYNGGLTGLGSPAPIYWAPSASAIGSVTFVGVYGGSGGNRFNVYNTSNLYYYTYLSTGGGSNTVNVVGTTGKLNISGSWTDTLVGPNTTNTWNITGPDHGTLGVVTFWGVANLTGGTSNDTFKFASDGSVSGKIDGDGGTNWLDYAACTTPVTVNLAADTATGVGGGIAHIRNIRGGQGGDTLIGDAQGNILIGGAGPNTIVGGTGRSLLLGGKGKDTITGRSGGDILIAGSTDFDSSSLAHDLALDAILAEWQSANPYATRISHLETGGGLNGSNKLVWGVTVHDNSASDANKLTGGAGGQNWFFANLTQTTTNKKACEQLN
jgi:hypothetical protein